MQRQRGFSMIEVLITMVVISVGLLGIAGIIVMNLKNNQSASARGQATILASDIIDRMRANRTVALGNPSPYALALTAASPSPSATVVATNDLAEWRAALASSIKSGTGAVVFNAVSGNVVVTVQWDDRRGAGDGVRVGVANQTFVVETRL